MYKTDSDLTVIQHFLDRCFKRKYTSIKRIAIRDLLEKADKKLLKVCLVDHDCLLSNIIPKKKETKYHLRNRTAYHPQINSDRFKTMYQDLSPFLRFWTGVNSFSSHFYKLWYVQILNGLHDCDYY